MRSDLWIFGALLLYWPRKTKSVSIHGIDFSNSRATTLTEREFVHRRFDAYDYTFPSYLYVTTALWFYRQKCHSARSEYDMQAEFYKAQLRNVLHNLSLK